MLKIIVFCVEDYCVFVEDYCVFVEDYCVFLLKIMVLKPSLGLL